MTTQEIKDLIATKIAGQGNQVDSGGKLADILNAICENIEQKADEKPVFELSGRLYSGMSTNEFNATGLTADVVREIANHEYNDTYLKFGDEIYYISQINITTSPFELITISLFNADWKASITLTPSLTLVFSTYQASNA